ncbi:thermostable hemolysin [Solimonas soli]|uniref:thermostable hemolysin n=1 Tax=Solimonas soli TaxID=413479 RepID=UPI00047FC222|nr:thermostable hemolysin [Solimonas soli]
MTASPERHAAPSAAASRYRLVEADTATDRAELERFIAERYRHAYGARIRSFLPRLFALADAGGRPLAAFGLRDAASGPLFLEHYLGQPIEQAIGERREHALSRHEIVEVGNLAGRHPGVLRVLILQLGILLQNMGYRFLVFTGNASLINGFARLGVDLLELAPARVDCLPPEQRADWGRYYESAPIVVCADISAGRAHLLAHPELLRRALPPTASGEPA